MDFYVNVFSDASSASFSDNRPGNFKTLLSREIDLKNIEYSVAVCSVGRYYETVDKDVVFIREKRATPIEEPLQLTVHTIYPTTQHVNWIKKTYENFIKKEDPIYALVSGTDKFEVELNVDGKKKTFEIYSNPIYKSTLQKAVSFTSDTFEDVRFELGDMLGVGIITIISDGKAHAVTVTFPDKTQKKLAIVQPSFSAQMTADKKRSPIELRAKGWKSSFIDLRTTLPYLVQFSENKNAKIKLFEKTGGALGDYLQPPFYGNAKSVTLLDASRHPYWKIHPTIAKLFKLPEEIEFKPQYIDIYITQNSVEKLLMSYLISDVHTTAEAIEAYLNNFSGKLSVPYKITCKRTGDSFDLDITEGVRVVLPHAFNSFTFKFTTSLGEWPCSISYVDDAGMGQTKKPFKVSSRKTFATQVQALQEATTKTFKEITTEIIKEITGKDASEQEITAAAIPFRIRRHRNQQVITTIDMPEGYELEIDQGLATSLNLKRKFFSAMTDYAWITCNIVGDSFVGESSMPLLTLTPLKMTTSVITNREYVPVSSNTFQTLHLQMISNLKTLEPYDGPNNVLIVLHFKAKHKRSGYVLDKEEAKRLRTNEEEDGRGSRILQ